MKLKFTKSQDGQMRANIRITVRLTAEEIEEIQQKAYVENYDSWREFLAMAAAENSDTGKVTANPR